MTQEMKNRMADLKSRFKKINDDFLDLFEKRNIIFMEDGVDLKNDCHIFKEKERQADILIR